MRSSLPLGAFSPTVTPFPAALGLTAAEFDALPVLPGASLISGSSRDARPVEYADLFETRTSTPSTLSATSPALTDWARRHGVALRVLIPLRHERGEASEKFLFGLPDGRAVESVLIRRHDGYTACVSSQVGCAFACRFCASGQAGLKRHLTAGEIVEQVVSLGPRVNRIVFMGIGEPLSNYHNVLKAIRILRERRGLDFPTTGITVSTIGIPDALRRLREEHLAINLTISLHATTQEVRDRLVPGARKHAVAEVVRRALDWADRHNRVVTFAYLLLPGLNDARDDVKRLAALLAGRKARVNLMRWNAVDGVKLPGTDERRLAAFHESLVRAGVSAVVRDTRGRDIDAACGQLWLRDLRGMRLAESRKAPSNVPTSTQERRGTMLKV